MEKRWKQWKQNIAIWAGAFPYLAQLRAGLLFTWTDPDDASEQTDAWFEKAGLCEGDMLIRRRCPKSETPKEAVNLRLDPDELAHFRSAGRLARLERGRRGAAMGYVVTVLDTPNREEQGRAVLVATGVTVTPADVVIFVLGRGDAEAARLVPSFQPQSRFRT